MPIVEGTVFRQEWIRWARRLAWKEFSEFVLYIDPSWKSKKANDTKAAKLWAKRKTELWHLRAFVRKASIAELVRWCYDLYEWSRDTGIAIRFAMEASFMQDMILDDFTEEGNQRGYQLPITGDTRKKPDKFQRIEAVSPLWERGFVFYDQAQKEDPTCRLDDWSSCWLLRKACQATTMHLMPTRVPFTSCRRIQDSRFIHRGSASVRPPKTNGNMFQLIKDIIFGFRFKRAVKKADRFHHITHRKYMVLVINRKIEVLSKQEIKEFVANGIFRKGTTVSDIERKALYITL